MKRVKFRLPSAMIHDATGRELSITLDGTTQTATLAGDCNLSQEFGFRDDSKLAVVLTDIDKKGNRSEPTPVCNFDLSDEDHDEKCPIQLVEVKTTEENTED